MKNRSDDIRTTDDLDLAIETLKDLTPSATNADEVRGGRTSSVRGCYCGTM
jgi:hypothetical protein